MDEPPLRVGGKWGGVLPSTPEARNYLWHRNHGGGLRDWLDWVDERYALADDGRRP